jgi:hypothetical protein
MASALALALGDQCPDPWHELVRNVHYGFGRLNTCFILRQSVLLSLLFVMSEHAEHLLLIPIGGNLPSLIVASSSSACESASGTRRLTNLRDENCEGRKRSTQAEASPNSRFVWRYDPKERFVTNNASTYLAPPAC